MRIVLVVGAGGSLAQAMSYRPRQARDHPPLDGNFFPKAERLAREDGRLTTLISDFRDDLEENAEFPDPWGETVPGPLERFFADVYYEVASHRSSTAFDALKGLLKLYIRVLATTTNWMTVRRDAGGMDRLIRREIERAGGETPTVITFNQDLVIENVVARLPRRRDSWCLEGLYGDPDAHVVGRPGRSRFRRHTAECPHRAPIQLLKLHGSLNWAVRTTERDPRLATLFPTRRDKAVFVTDDRRGLPDVATIRSRAGAGRTRWYLWPLIVPPIYDKQRITGISFLQSFWDVAEESIRGAQRLLLVGYSLPEADVLARQMLRRAFLGAPLSAVHCINPDVGVAAKLKQHLDCRVVHLYHDFNAYLAGE